MRITVVPNTGSMIGAMYDGFGTAGTVNTVLGSVTLAADGLRCPATASNGTAGAGSGADAAVSAGGADGARSGGASWDRAAVVQATNRIASSRPAGRK